MDMMWEAVVHTAVFDLCKGRRNRTKGEVKLKGSRQQGGIFVQFSQI